MQALCEPRRSNYHPHKVRLLFSFILLALSLTCGTALAQAGGTMADRWGQHFSHLTWCNIGPAVTGGRIVDFAVLDESP